MQVWDAHFHVWEAETPQRPRARRPNPWVPDPNPVDKVLPILDENGIAVAIQVTHSIMGYDNRYSLEAARANPGRLRVFGRFQPAAPDSLQRLEEWLANPWAAGVRLTFFNSPEEPVLTSSLLTPFWEAAEQLHLPVAVYAPTALPDLLTVVKRHPGLRIIIDHLGLAVHSGVSDPFASFPELRTFVPFDSVRVKVSALYQLSKERYPFTDVHSYLAQAVEWFGASRLIWGSDYPNTLKCCTYADSLNYLNECTFIGASDLEWIMGRTLREFIEPEYAGPS